MAFILSPLADCRDTAALADVRAALLTARTAITAARSQLHSWEAATRIGDLVTSIEMEIEGVAATAEAVADEDCEIEWRRQEAQRCFSRYAAA